MPRIPADSFDFSNPRFVKERAALGLSPVDVALVVCDPANVVATWFSRGRFALEMHGEPVWGVRVSVLIVLNTPDSYTILHIRRL